MDAGAPGIAGTLIFPPCGPFNFYTSVTNHCPSSPLSPCACFGSLCVVKSLIQERIRPLFLPRYYRLVHCMRLDLRRLNSFLSIFLPLTFLFYFAFPVTLNKQVFRMEFMHLGYLGFRLRYLIKELNTHQIISLYQGVRYAVRNQTGPSCTARLYTECVSAPLASISF